MKISLSRFSPMRIIRPLVFAVALATCGGQANQVKEDPLPHIPTPSETLPKSPPKLLADEVFRHDRVLEYHLTVSQDDLSHLEEHGHDEKYLPARLKVSGKGFKTVDLRQIGVRYKGAWSLHHCWDDNNGKRKRTDECAKLSVKIQFDEFEQSARLHGLKRLNFNASNFQMLPEILALSTFADAGITTPRFAPAMLYINGKLSGLYLAVENVDGRFTKARHPDTGDGNLFKEVWPQPGLPDDHFSYHLETNRQNPDVSDIQGFARAIGQTSADTFAADMAPWIDLDMTLHYMAVDRAIKNWDGITAFYTPQSPHNFYWYRDNASGARFQTIPWDLNNTFWKFDPYMHPQEWATAQPVPDWNVQPASCLPITTWNNAQLTPPGCDKFMQLLASTQWGKFVQIADILLAEPLSAAALDEKLTYWAKFLSPFVEQDPFMHIGDWNWHVEALRPIVSSTPDYLRGFVAEGYLTHPPANYN